MCRSLENFRTPRFHWHLRRGRAKQPARLSMRPRTCPQFENAPARSEPELVNLRRRTCISIRLLNRDLLIFHLLLQRLYRFGERLHLLAQVFDI